MREKKEEEERRLVAQQKQEREASKRAIKRERKQLRSLCKVMSESFPCYDD